MDSDSIQFQSRYSTEIKKHKARLNFATWCLGRSKRAYLTQGPTFDFSNLFFQSNMHVCKKIRKDRNKLNDNQLTLLAYYNNGIKI